ncbi:MAG: hypothetical protein NUW01_01390 [Gemmatimonadaceae bacterium]|nr:hypothetical protein [Gemmatimonadaceae bacterium]
MSFLSSVKVAASIADFSVKKLFNMFVGNTTVAALGSSATDAAPLTSGKNMVTGADGTTGVKLPVAEPGMSVTVVNTVSTSDLKTYPNTSAQINALTATSGAFTIPGGQEAVFHCDVLLHWYVSTGSGASAAELEVLNGASATNATTGKAAILGTGGALTIGGALTAVTSIGIGGAVLTEAEMEMLDTLSAGVATASKAAILGANRELDEFHTAALYIGAGAGTLVGSTAAQLDAAVAGTPLVYRTNVTAAQVNAGTTAVVPAVASKRFQVLHISMAAAGGAVSGPTTVEVIEETAGTVFLSHVTADLTDGVWHNHITGTPVITGITNGGMTSADNKALLVTKTGGTDFATATGLDVVVVGYYTTT